MGFEWRGAVIIFFKAEEQFISGPLYAGE